MKDFLVYVLESIFKNSLIITISIGIILSNFINIDLKYYCIGCISAKFIYILISYLDYERD